MIDDNIEVVRVLEQILITQQELLTEVRNLRGVIELVRVENGNPPVNPFYID